MSGHKPQHGKQNSAPKPKQDGGEDKSNKRHVYVEPGVQIDFVKDFREEYKTSQNQNTAQNKKQLFWTKVSAFLLLFYVGVTLLIYRANQQANDLTERSLRTNEARFRTEQRPYMTAEAQGGWLNKDTNERYIFEPNGSGWVHIRFVLTNSGKSPSIDTVGGATLVFVGPTAEVRQKLEDFAPHYANTEGGTVPVGASFVPSSEEPRLTPEQIKWLGDGTWEMYAVGETRYRDIYDPRLPDLYRTGYCVQYVPVGLPFGICPSHNYIK